MQAALTCCFSSDANWQILKYGRIPDEVISFSVIWTGFFFRFFFFFLLFSSSPLQRLGDEKCLQIVSYHKCGCFSTQMSASISLQKRGDAGLQTPTNSCLDARSIIPLRCPAASCAFYANHPSVVKPRLSCSPEAARWHISKSFRPWRRGQLCQLLLSEDAASLPPSPGVGRPLRSSPPSLLDPQEGTERPRVPDHISGEDTQRNHAFINNTGRSIFSLEMSCIWRENKKNISLVVLFFLEINAECVCSDALWLHVEMSQSTSVWCE